MSVVGASRAYGFTRRALPFYDEAGLVIAARRDPQHRRTYDWYGSPKLEAARAQANARLSAIGKAVALPRNGDTLTSSRARGRG